MKTALVARIQEVLARFDPSNPRDRQLACASMSLFIALVRAHSGRKCQGLVRTLSSQTQFASEPSSAVDNGMSRTPGQSDLHAAILLGMSLVTRSRTTGDAGDITALKDIEARIEGELSRLEKMEKYSNSIRKNVDDISDEVRKAQKALDLLLRKARRLVPGPRRVPDANRIWHAS